MDSLTRKATAVAIAIVAVVFVATWAATRHDSTTSTPTLSAVGLQAVDPGRTLALSSALSAAGVPFIVIDATTLGVHPDQLDNATRAIADPANGATDIEYTTINATVEPPPPPASATPAPTQPETPPSHPTVTSTVTSTADLLPQGTDTNQVWSPRSTLANATTPATFITFDTTEHAQAATQWLTAAIELGNHEAISMLAPSSNPLTWLAYTPIPDTTRSALTTATHNGVTFTSGTALNFDVHTPLTPNAAHTLTQTLPIPLTAIEAPSGTVLTYLGPIPSRTEFDALGRSLAQAGIPQPVALGTS